MLEFKPINISADLETAINFTREAFVVSFGNDKEFMGEDGEGIKYYSQWLQGKDVFPFHLWDSDKIIGQVVLGCSSKEEAGFVFLYYLTPDYRGRGVSKILDEFACKTLKAQGFLKAQLSVSPTNERAFRFYQNCGWISRGPRFSQEELVTNKRQQVLLMEKFLTDAGTPGGPQLS